MTTLPKNYFAHYGTAVESQPRVGARMPDGSIYAGLSPETGKAMYATESDCPLTYTFKDAAGYGRTSTLRYISGMMTGAYPR